ncbi:MAG: HAMP domain-containing sensor histidine kinase [Planctomycetota bacterium]
MKSNRPNDDSSQQPQRRSVNKPEHRHPGDPSDPAAAPDLLGNVAVLVHELGNLLDGSLRCLGLARRSLCASDVWLKDPQAERVGKQLDAASTAMEQMAGLVHAALQGPNLTIGSQLISGARPVTLSAAIDHAVEVMKPAATDLGVTLSTTITDTAGELPVGPLYLVILNGLRNAVESLGRLGPVSENLCIGGSIHVHAKVEEFDLRTATVRKMIAVEITDDGQGPPTGTDIARVFDHGFSKKTKGSGMGLAIAKSVVERMGGTISLLRRREPRDASRPGAILRICVPAPTFE